MNGIRLASLALAVLLWAELSRLRLIPAGAFGNPADAARWMAAWIRSGTGALDVLTTFEETAGGYVAGVTIGTVVAIAFRVVPYLGRLLDPAMGLLNAVPRVVLAPLLVVVLGTGISSKVALATLMVVFIVFFNLSGGLASMDDVLAENARIQGGRSLDLVLHVYLPGVFSWIITSLRVSVGFAFVGAVVGELVAANHGLGFVINLGQQLNNPSEIVGGVLVLVVIAYFLDQCLVLIDQRMTRWKPA